MVSHAEIPTRGKSSTFGVACSQDGSVVALGGNVPGNTEMSVFFQISGYLFVVAKYYSHSF